MEITSYSFGRISIEGRAYTSDVIIYPDRVDPSWWRKEGHLLRPEDLSKVLEAKPDILIIGTGAEEAMKVPEETLHFLHKRGVEVHVLDTQEAVARYNAIDKEGRTVIAALHL
ncbi:MAG: Mth938-like domain-containing protein, partial [Nitrospirota bacterium]